VTGPWLRRLLKVGPASRKASAAEFLERRLAALLRARLPTPGTPWRRSGEECSTAYNV